MKRAVPREYADAISQNMKLKQENSVVFFPAEVADPKVLVDVREAVKRVAPVVAFHRRTRVNDEVSVIFHGDNISIGINHLWLVVGLKKTSEP